MSGVTVIIPVGPGHETRAEEARNSCALAAKQNEFFTKIKCITELDLKGEGRSKARNRAIRRATTDWLFFLDADDLCHLLTFINVVPYLKYDAIWSHIYEMKMDEPGFYERKDQITPITRIEDILLRDPFQTIHTGHFVRKEICPLFDEDMDAGEDFKQFIELWDQHNCIKIPEPLFINRRGEHSQGPRSASGRDWRRSVERQLREFSIEHFKRCEVPGIPV